MTEIAVILLSIFAILQVLQNHSIAKSIINLRKQIAMITLMLHEKENKNEVF